MRTILETPEGFIERFDIRSGAMEREGFNPCGVIFTTQNDPSPDQFDATRLEGAIFENTQLPEEETRRFLTIVGGYYMERQGEASESAVCKTTHVFGVAGDSSAGFDITEGGTRILADDWKLSKKTEETFNPVRMMNERELGGSAGWTLIVREAHLENRILYPKSGEAIELKVLCTEIKEISMTSASKRDDAMTHDFTVATEGIAPSSCTWNFGDGSEELRTNENASSHTYKMLREEKTYIVKVTLNGPNSCTTSQTTTVTIPSLPCPEVTELTCV